MHPIQRTGFLLCAFIWSWDGDLKSNQDNIGRGGEAACAIFLATSWLLCYGIGVVREEIDKVKQMVVKLGIVTRTVNSANGRVC